MEKEILRKYKESGRILAEIKEKILKKIAPGTLILNLAEFIENEINRMGAKLAFPPNISINDFAAHYTPKINDDWKIASGDIVKIDIGAHIDGYIADMAFSYCSEKNKLIETAEKALKNAINIIKPEVTVSEISKVIEETAKSNECGLVVNLTGHTLDKFQFHGEPNIPNVSNNIDYKFKEGDVLAIEPFITKQNAFVKESGTKEIYQYIQDKPVRLMEARKILQFAKIDYNGLPFAKRWLYNNISAVKVSLALKELEKIGAIKSYPVLKVDNNMKVAQAEHTIIVGNPSIVTTKL